MKSKSRTIALTLLALTCVISLIAIAYREDPKMDDLTRAEVKELDGLIMVIDAVEKVDIKIKYSILNFFPFKRHISGAVVLLKLKLGRELKPAECKTIRALIANSIKGLDEPHVVIEEARP